MGASFREFVTLDEGWFKNLMGFGGQEQPEEEEEERERWPTGAVYMQYKDFLNCSGKPTSMYVIVANPEIEDQAASPIIKAVQIPIIKLPMGGKIKNVMDAFGKPVAYVAEKMQDQIGDRPCMALKAVALDDPSQGPMAIAALEKMPWPQVTPGRGRKDPSLVLKLGKPGQQMAQRPTPQAKPQAAPMARPQPAAQAKPQAAPMAKPAAPVQKPQAANGVKKCPGCGRTAPAGYCMVCDIQT